MRPEDLLLRSLFQALKEKKAAWRHRELASTLKTARSREFEGKQRGDWGQRRSRVPSLFFHSFHISIFSLQSSFRATPYDRNAWGLLPSLQRALALRIYWEVTIGVEVREAFFLKSSSFFPKIFFFPRILLWARSHGGSEEGRVTKLLHSYIQIHFLKET